MAKHDKKYSGRKSSGKKYSGKSGGRMTMRKQKPKGKKIYHVGGYQA